MIPLIYEQPSSLTILNEIRKPCKYNNIVKLLKDFTIDKTVGNTSVRIDEMSTLHRRRHCLIKLQILSNRFYVPWTQIITKLFVRGVIQFLMKPRNYLGHNTYCQLFVKPIAV